MPNCNYIKGRRKEYSIVNEAKAKGHIAFRSAGSHSPIDVVDIDVLNRIIRFVQSKPDSMSRKKRDELLMANNLLNGSFFAKFEVV